MSDESEKDRENEYKGLWKENPYTRHLLAKEKMLLQQAIVLLLGKCAVTTDPDIARSYAFVVARQAAIRLLESGDT
jgi:hypothetical protein